MARSKFVILTNFPYVEDILFMQNPFLCAKPFRREWVPTAFLAILVENIYFCALNITSEKRHKMLFNIKDNIQHGFHSSLRMRYSLMRDTGFFFRLVIMSYIKHVSDHETVCMFIS